MHQDRDGNVSLHTEVMQKHAETFRIKFFFFFFNLKCPKYKIIISEISTEMEGPLGGACPLGGASAETVLSSAAMRGRR